MPLIIARVSHARILLNPTKYYKLILVNGLMYTGISSNAFSCLIVMGYKKIPTNTVFASIMSGTCMHVCQ